MVPRLKHPFLTGIELSAGMMAWGDRMLKFTGKQRADMYSAPAQEKQKRS